MINCHASPKPSALQLRFPNHHHRSCASVAPSCISLQSFWGGKKKKAIIIVKWQPQKEVDLPGAKTRSLKTGSPKLPLLAGWRGAPFVKAGRSETPPTPQPRARVGPGTTAPRGPRPRTLGGLFGSEPAPEVTGLPASPFSAHTPTQLSHLQGRSGRMKPSPRRNAPRWKHLPPACGNGGTPAPPLGSRASPATVATLSPSPSEAVPRATFLATPSPLPGRPGVRPPGGAREGRERPTEAQPSAPDPRAPTQSAWSGRRHLFSPGPRGWGSLPATIALLPEAKFPSALAFPVARGTARANPTALWPGKQKLAPGAGGTGEPRLATHPGAWELPGSLRSAVEGRP